MKRSMMILALVAMAFALLVDARPVAAQKQTPPGFEPYDGQPLCQPDAYLYDPKDCVPMGPSQTITQMAQQGIVYPFLPIQADKPDISLNDTDLKFARVNVDFPESAPLFSSLADAEAGTNPTGRIQPGNYLYVSYTNRADVGGAHYLFLRSGAWMRASPAEYTHFQGLVFDQNPAARMGWIIEQVKPRSAPSFSAPELTDPLILQSVVQIYETQDNEGGKWYMVGMNQWVERRYIRELPLATTPPPGVDNNRWIDINLYEQTLAVYENGQLKFATIIASGLKPYYTQPGLFKIYKKKPTETMSGAFEADKSDYYYLQDVPWTMYFDHARAIHGAYWRAIFGREVSHGCVNMSIGDAHWVYDWAKEGDWVYVHDPSGVTPTDPKLYSDGGA
jgi:hypothetical protein